MLPDRLITRLLPVIREDDALLVVHKPPGIDVGGVEGEGGGLLALLSAVRGDLGTLHATNRLSRYESGVLVLAKSATIARQIRTALRSGRVDQRYVVVSTLAKRGAMPRAPGRGGKRSRGGVPSRRAQSRGKPPGPQKAALRVLRAGERRALVQCDTRAATTHELRAALRGEGMRLWGDRIGTQSKRPPPHHVTHLHLSRLILKSEKGEKQAFHAKPPATFDQSLDGPLHPARVMTAALARRLPGLIDVQSDAYRLLTGDREGMPGVTVHRWGDLVVIDTTADANLTKRTLREIADWCREPLDVETVACRTAPRKGGRGPDSQSVAPVSNRWSGPRSLNEPPGLDLIRGESLPETVVIEERGLRFEIRPDAGASVGLFLDQRENRTRVRTMSHGADVLNLFAYTCGFSVAAAAGGAKRTVSVDIATGSLEWGKRNFALNTIALDDHTFIRSDADDYLKRATRQGLTFDVIIIDAPTFAHARRGRKAFAVKTDLEPLIRAAADRLRPGGTMMVTVNQRTLSSAWLRERVRAACPGHARIVESPTLPFDFQMDPDHSKTILVRLPEIETTPQPTRADS